MEAKKYLCICRICHQEFYSGAANGTLCSQSCKILRKEETDKAYRLTEHGQAVRRKNRKNPITIETRKRYEQTEKFKQSKHIRNKIYMQTPAAQELEKKRKLNYYYSHFSKKYNLYNPNAYKVTLSDIRQLYSSDSCFYCNKKLTESEKTVDHKIPVSKGGTNEMQNLVIACQNCNSKKNNKTYIEYKGA